MQKQNWKNTITHKKYQNTENSQQSSDAGFDQQIYKNWEKISLSQKTKPTKWQ